MVSGIVDNFTYMNITKEFFIQMKLEECKTILINYSKKLIKEFNMVLVLNTHFRRKIRNYRKSSWKRKKR